jgi:hypothetical protein
MLSVKSQEPNDGRHKCLQENVVAPVDYKQEELHVFFALRVHVCTPVDAFA